MSMRNMILLLEVTLETEPLDVLHIRPIYAQLSLFACDESYENYYSIIQYTAPLQIRIK